MTTIYFGLVEENKEWIKIKSKKPIRNCKQASQIANKTIINFKIAPLIYQFFRFL